MEAMRMVRRGTWVLRYLTAQHRKANIAFAESGRCGRLLNSLPSPWPLPTFPRRLRRWPKKMSCELQVLFYVLCVTVMSSLLWFSRSTCGRECRELQKICNLGSARRKDSTSLAKAGGFPHRAFSTRMLSFSRFFNSNSSTRFFKLPSSISFIVHRQFCRKEPRHSFHVVQPRFHFRPSCLPRSQLRPDLPATISSHW